MQAEGLDAAARSGSRSGQLLRTRRAARFLMTNPAAR